MKNSSFLKQFSDYFKQRWPFLTTALFFAALSTAAIIYLTPLAISKSFVNNKIDIMYNKTSEEEITSSSEPVQSSEPPVSSEPLVLRTSGTGAIKRNPPVFTNLVTTHTISGELKESDAVGSEFFDNAIFIGDSISLKLCYYNSSMHVLGGAAFLTAGSYSTIDGLDEHIENKIASSGKTKIYIMLGMNDIGRGGTQGGISPTVSRMEQMCNNIIARIPNCEIFIESMTPITATSNRLSERLNNNVIYDYNCELSNLCAMRGFKFVNVASVMYDGDGNLRSDYCSDGAGMGMHFTNAGCAAWVQYLYTHNGIYPPEPEPQTSGDDSSSDTSSESSETSSETTGEETEKPQTDEEGTSHESTESN